VDTKDILKDNTVRFARYRVVRAAYASALRAFSGAPQQVDERNASKSSADSGFEQAATPAIGRLGRRTTALLIVVFAAIGLIFAFYESNTPLETGPQSACKRDSDCSCRVFDGSTFHPGRMPSRCEVGRCATCIYL
jgi:hypothetical protein